MVVEVLYRAGDVRTMIWKVRMNEAYKKNFGALKIWEKHFYRGVVLVIRRFIIESVGAVLDPPAKSSVDK